MPLGLLAYLGWWELRAGDGLFPIRLQETHWAHVRAWPWTTLWTGVRQGTTGIAEFSNGYPQLDLVLVAVALAGTVWALRRLPPSYGLWTLASVLLPLVTPTPFRVLISAPRYFVVVFPLTWAIARFAERFRAHDLVVAASAGLLGLPGRAARDQLLRLLMGALRRAGPAVVALCVLTLAVGWWSKARCLVDGTWTDDEQYLEWCYTDIYPLWFAERLSEGAVPYVDHPVEYPVLTGLQMWVGQQLVQPLPDDQRPVAYFHVSSLLNAAFVLGVLALLAAAGLPRDRLLWWALAPTLALHAFINWDPLAVLFLVAAIVAHLRGHDTAAGVAAGLGTAAKLIPGVVVPVIVLARLAQGRPATRCATASRSWAPGRWSTCPSRSWRPTGGAGSSSSTATAHRTGTACGSSRSRRWAPRSRTSSTPPRPPCWSRGPS